MLRELAFHSGGCVGTGRGQTLGSAGSLTPLPRCKLPVHSIMEEFSPARSGGAGPRPSDSWTPPREEIAQPPQAAYSSVWSPSLKFSEEPDCCSAFHTVPDPRIYCHSHLSSCRFLVHQLLCRGTGCLVTWVRLQQSGRNQPSCQPVHWSPGKPCWVCLAPKSCHLLLQANPGIASPLGRPSPKRKWFIFSRCAISFLMREL